MDLPNEIYLSVFVRLNRTDLKSCRLVSTLWCSCASKFLFDEICVSSAKVDLEAFETITQSALLSGCVRHLRYDGTEFLKGLSKQQYINELWNQKPQFVEDEKENFLPWDTTDAEINEWVNVVTCNRLSFQETLEKFQTSQLIEKGYQEYQRQATYQQSLLGSDHLLQRLTQGLRKLESLRSVTLEGSWRYMRRFKQRETGSYLARHWDPYHCRPQSWCWGEASPYLNEDIWYTHNGPDGARHYRMVTSALVQSRRHITSFASFTNFGTFHHLSPGLPPTLFGSSGYATRERMEDVDMDLIAFSNLERFALRLAAYAKSWEEGEATPKIFKNIDHLPRLLQSMQHLKHLELNLSPDLSAPPILYTNEQVFPKGTIWPSLRSLILIDLSITAMDLLHFVLYRTPNLKHLKLGGISLLEGTWEGFFEALAQSRHLSSFNLADDTYLFHRGGQDFLTDERDFPGSEDLENYVVRGGRHPCLNKDQPDSAARKYLDQFDDLIREHLVQLGDASNKAA